MADHIQQKQQQQQQSQKQQQRQASKPLLQIDPTSAQAVAAISSISSFSPSSSSPLSLASPQATSPRHERDAARAIRRTDSWKPAVLARRLSYDMEDRKRQAQMRAVAGLGEEPGFSERSP